MTAAPSFTVVIPTFQRRDVVVAAVRALSKVEYTGTLEAIVVVDGSTDGTAAALSAIETPFPLRVLEQSNGGAASARNRGASCAKGDVILFLDDDMMAEPDLIEEHARMYRDGADAVVGHVPVDPSSPPNFLTIAIAKWVDSARLGSKLTPFDVFTGQLSVRRSIFDQLEGFNEEYTKPPLFAHEDTDFGVRLLERWDVKYNPRAVSKQRYVVRPREIIRRASQAAVADLWFASRHPQLTRRLFEERGVSTKRARYLYRPLSQVPLLPKIAGEVAIRTAEVALKTRFGSSMIVRHFFGFARALVYWSALRANGGTPDSKELLVLCYHAIQDQSDDPVLAPYGVPIRLFEEHLEWLRRRRTNFITPGALASFLENGSPLPRRSVLLTFDDCYSDLLDVATNVLQPSGIGGIAFAVTGMKSGSNEWDQKHGSRRVTLLDSRGLRTLRSLGFDIGSHSRTHRDMALLSPKEVESEASGSAEDLVSSGLPRPRFFSYPYGSPSAASIQAVRAAGYLAAFSRRSGRVRGNTNRYELPRVMIYACHKGWRFRAKLAAPALAAGLERISDAAGRRIRQFTGGLNGSD